MTARNGDSRRAADIIADDLRIEHQRRTGLDRDLWLGLDKGELAVLPIAPLVTVLKALEQKGPVRIVLHGVGIAYLCGLCNQYGPSRPRVSDRMDPHEVQHDPTCPIHWLRSAVGGG